MSLLVDRLHCAKHKAPEKCATDTTYFFQHSDTILTSTWDMIRLLSEGKVTGWATAILDIHTTSYLKLIKKKK